MVEAADVFFEHFGILPKRPTAELLSALGVAFAHLPYENLTKLVKKAQHAPGPARRRLPDEVLKDHLTRGAGGTCFALTRLFGDVLKRAGFRCFPVLCDMRYRPDSHCALAVEVGSRLLLIDPGYLLHEPLPFESGPTGYGHRQARLVSATEGPQAWDLYTYGAWRYRLKLGPVSAEHFLSVWDASFDWTMMNDVHLCAPRADGYTYVHGHKLRTRQGTSKTTENIRGMEDLVLSQQFGMSAELVSRALNFVAQQRARGQSLAKDREKR